MILLGMGRMAVGIGRRQFISALGGVTAAWPFAARGQQLPTVGFMGANASAFTPWTAAFVERLRELGWIEGRTVRIEYRWSEGRPERTAEIAAEFVRLNVNVILTFGSAVSALKQVTSVIPIVFALSPDPVGGGLVASLARPGGNATGLSVQAADVASKRLEYLREVVPHLRRLAVMLHVGFPEAVLEMGEVKVAARRLGLEVTPLEIRRAEDIAPALDELNAKADALYVVSNALFAAARTRLITLAVGQHLPTIFSIRDYVQAGGLMSYGPNIAALFGRAADLVDKILRGAKPADIPVEQPTKFDFVINLTTAKALGLTIPPTLLALADEVIE
jgi:putative ABC transport system substrate-binding protein